MTTEETITVATVITETPNNNDNTNGHLKGGDVPKREEEETGITKYKNNNRNNKNKKIQKKQQKKNKNKINKKDIKIGTLNIRGFKQ